MSDATAIDAGYLDLQGLSLYSSLGVSTLRDYCRSGGLPHFKLRGKVLIRVEEFDSWLEGFRVTGPDVDAVADEILEDLKTGKSDA